MNKYSNKISQKLFPVRPPLYADKLLSDFTWRIQNSNKIYLSFDDGPTPEITEQTLEILNKKNIKATFFCLGRNVERFPCIYKKILKNGHKTGNHTYSHLNGWKTNYTEYINDIDLAGNYIKTKLFRPPYGKIKPRQLKYTKQQYKIIMWDVLSGDFNPQFTPDYCLNNVLKFTKQGSIIVFHDSIKASKNMLYTLPRIIDHFLNKGFKFDTIP